MKRQVLHKSSALSNRVVHSLKVVILILASMPKQHLSVTFSNVISLHKDIQCKYNILTATTAGAALTKKVHLPNHLMLGSTLATVPGATVDWYCKGLMTFPRLLLGTEDQHQCMRHIFFVVFHCHLRKCANLWASRIIQICISNYHLCFCLYIFRRLIVDRSLILFPPAPFARSVKYV